MTVHSFFWPLICNEVLGKALPSQGNPLVLGLTMGPTAWGRRAGCVQWRCRSLCSSVRIFLSIGAAPRGQVEEATRVFGFFGFCPVPLPLLPSGSSTVLPLPLWGGTLLLCPWLQDRPPAASCWEGTLCIAVGPFPSTPCHRRLQAPSGIVYCTPARRGVGLPSGGD